MLNWWSASSSKEDFFSSELELEPLEDRAVPTVIATDDTYGLSVSSTLTVPAARGVLSNDTSTTGALSAELLSGPFFSFPPQVLAGGQDINTLIRTLPLLPGPVPTNPSSIPLRNEFLTMGADGSLNIVIPSNLPPGTLTYRYIARSAGGEVTTATLTITVGPRPSRLFAAGAGAGDGPQVIVYDAQTRLPIRSFFAFNPAFQGGVNVAVGDLNNDNIDDIVVGAGPGGGPHVIVFDGVTGQPIRSFFAYAPAFTGGVNVAVGDVNGNGINDIITAPQSNGGPNVRVFSGATGNLIRSFFAYNPAFTGGVNIASGDLDGGGVDEIITGAGPGGGPHVRAFDVFIGFLPPREQVNFFAYGANVTQGVFVAAGNVRGLGVDEIITTAGNFTGEVRVWSGLPAFSGTILNSYTAFETTPFTQNTPATLPPNAPIGLSNPANPALFLSPPPTLVPGGLVPQFTNPANQPAPFNFGLRVATTDRNGDGVDDILVGTGPGVAARGQISSIRFGPQVVLDLFDFAFAPGFLGGVKVGG